MVATFSEAETTLPIWVRMSTQVSLFFYHALYSAHLPFYPPETIMELLLVSLFDVPVFPRHSFHGFVPCLLHNFLLIQPRPPQLAHDILVTLKPISSFSMP